MRTLIVNPFGIGDVLFSLPLVRALRQSFPDSHLGYLANRRTEELVAAWPELNWRLTLENDEFRSAWRLSKAEWLLFLRLLIRQVHQENFQVAIDLSLGWQMGLACWGAGIPRRIGFNFRGRGRFLTDSLPLEGFHIQPVPVYYLDLLRFLQVNPPQEISSTLALPEEALSRTEEYLKAQQVMRDNRLVGILPGGGASWGPWAPFKQWPPERFAEVADRAAARSGAKILLIGSQKEEPLCRAVAQSMKSPAPLILRAPSLMVLAGVLKRCDLVIGNDSGPMHLAQSVGTPTVTLFGPVDPSVYGPFPPQPIHRVISLGLVCRPCYRGFRFPPCPWDNACLRQLETSAVLAPVEALLKGS